MEIFERDRLGAYFTKIATTFAPDEKTAALITHLLPETGRAGVSRVETPGDQMPDVRCAQSVRKAPARQARHTKT
ncbi:hypothetical protein EAO71_25760 [Streptomyces sp. ms191]|nr:hypothetical protein EAO71_25760 [Streptomyces sp. ms191]